MTTTQLLLMTGFYLMLLGAVIFFTRAKMRRVLGALAGGAVFGAIGLAGIVIGESRLWWTIPNRGVAHFHLLLWLGLAVSSAPDYLILWRIVRRFGTRGLIWSVIVVAIIGPPRDYWIASTFPAWMTFSPGITPVLVDDIVYILLVLVGYGIMRILSGADKADALARTAAT